MGTMKNSILYALYEFDTPLFVSTFCINKNNPALHCNGKCQLVKMQKEQREQESDKMLKQLQTETLVCPIPSFIDFTRQEITERIGNNYPAFTHPIYSCLYTDSRKKPPQA